MSLHVEEEYEGSIKELTIICFLNCISYTITVSIDSKEKFSHLKTCLINYLFQDKIIDKCEPLCYELKCGIRYLDLDLTVEEYTNRSVKESLLLLERKSYNL